MSKSCPTCGGRLTPETKLPEWMPRDLWAAWVQHRKEIRHALKPSTIKAQLAKLDTWRQAGHSIKEIIEYSIFNGYQGLFEPKGKSVSQVGKSTGIVPDVEPMDDKELAALIAEFPNMAGGVH